MLYRCTLGATADGTRAARRRKDYNPAYHDHSACMCAARTANRCIAAWPPSRPGLEGPPQTAYPQKTLLCCAGARPVWPAAVKLDMLCASGTGTGAQGGGWFITYDKRSNGRWRIARDGLPGCFTGLVCLARKPSRNP